MARWVDRPPKGAKCKKRDWVHFTNGSFIAGSVKNWGEEELYLMSTHRGDKPLLIALTLDEAAAICSVLATTMMTILWDQRSEEYEAK